MHKLAQIISEKGFALADGAIGTNLFAKGLMTGDAPELWNLEQADKITELHQEFVAAGSDIILTNSFGGTGYRMKLHQADDLLAHLIRTAQSLPLPHKPRRWPMAGQISYGLRPCRHLKN